MENHLLVGNLTLMRCKRINILIDPSIGMWGVLIQNCTFAVVTPIYLAIHLSTSPSVSSRRASNLNVDIADLAVLPISLALGYLLPLILMTLPAPSIIGFDQKQTFISIWQNFPVWVSLAQMILAWAIPVSGTPATPKVMSPLRALYVGLIVVAGAGQVTTLTLLAASKFLPGLFAPEYVGSFSLGKVFVPAAITPTTKMPSLVSGSLLTLQFDQLIGSTSMALWSTALLVDAYRNGKSGYSIASLVAGAAAVMALTGPLGYVTACIWARDELIFAEATGDGKKDQ